MNKLAVMVAMVILSTRTVPAQQAGEATTAVGATMNVMEPMTYVALTESPTSGSIWKYGIGEGFREDAFNFAVTAGAGPGARIFGNTVSHDLAMVDLHFGWLFADLQGEDKWFRGNWEYIAELYTGGQFNPETAVFGGGAMGLRYNFITGTRWVPFLDGEVGASGANLGVPSESVKFEFNVQGGPGVHYFWRENMALTMQVRLIHFSDANLSQDNPSANAVLLLAGLSWFF